MFDLAAVQAALKEFGFEGWLLYDFRGSNVLAQRILGFGPDQIASRRFYYYVPAIGEPRKLVHRIESGMLDHLPGEKTIYLQWQQLEEGIAHLIGQAKHVAMEYSPRNANPYVSKVDAGTIELVKSLGVEVVSSGDLIQLFEATWTDQQWQLHLEADSHTTQGFDKAWALIAERVRAGGRIRETEVQQAIMDHFAENGLTTYHPPIVGVGPHSGDPHYAPQKGADADIGEGDFVLIDLWAKMDKPMAVYSDLTRVGFVGTKVPDKYEKIFQIVAAARDAAISCVREAFASGKSLQGWEVDQACREVIVAAGYGDYYVHRTGHSIGQETHGNGANMDNLETREQRRVMRCTCFSVEPGIYLPEFGVRSEVDVFVDVDGEVHVTGGPLQTNVLPIFQQH